ncbi:MAG: InlB B-repeat-containing protein [Oscillospiraceae bacterium]|nr:InlB B-repeat-containing protein [Oscillospiraceae bacterium]
MKKLNRVLSFIITVAMVLSMLPTFAMAAVGDKYMYVLNPKKLTNTTAYNTSELTFDNTTTDSTGAAIANAAPWQYQRKYNESGDLRSVASGSYYWMEIGGASNKTCWVAIDVKVPEAGTYTVDLQYRRHANSGGLIIYNLPQTTLTSSASQTFESEDVLATLNLGVDNSSAYYNAILEDIGTIETSQPNEVRTIIFKTNGMATGKTSNIVYLESLDITKTADPTTGGEEEQPTMYTVTYASGDAAVTAPEAQEVERGTEIDLPAALSREGNTFDGWNDGTTTYPAGAKYIVSAAVTFTAQWTENVVIEPTGGPVTLVFNKETLTNNTDIEDTTYIGGTDYTAFSINIANSDEGLARSTVSGYRAYLDMGNTYTNWLKSENTKGRLTFTTEAVTEAGYYKVNYQAVNTERPVITYVYINGAYAGMYDAEAVATEAKAEARDLNTVYINPAENGGKVDIQLRVAANYGVANTPYMMPAQITLTPVEDESFSYAGATVECDVPTTVEGSVTISPVVKLANGEVFDFNNYTINGAEDTTNTYITVSVGSVACLTAEKAVDLKINREVLDNKAALNKWTLTSVKSGDTTVTISGKINGIPFSKAYPISVPETDVEYFESEASYGFGVNYSELNSYVSVGAVSAGNVGSAEKGTTLTLKAQKEVEIEGTTYKFVGWKRGGASTDESIKDALSFTSYVSHLNEDTFTLWSNTYLTAVYDKIGDAAGQTVEFYNQDGTFLDSATAEYVKTLTEIPTVSLLGHTFEMWQYINKNGETEEFTPTSELYEAVTRVVAKQNPKTVAITFADGTNGVETVASKAAAAKEYEYGALVNAEEFYDIPTSSTACWYRNELMTRTAAKYAFYAWADMEVRPEFVSSIPEEFRTPKIILDTKTMDGAYMIEYDVYSKNLYEIVEAGILFSNIEDVTLRTFASGEKFTSQNNKIHGQFAAKPSEEWTNVRGYIIYRELENDNLGIVYSDDGAVSN